MAEKKRVINDSERLIERTKKKRLYAREHGLFGAIQIAEKEYKESFENHNKIIFSSPEAYIYEGMNRLREAKDILDGDGNIIEAPYVKEQIAHIMGIIDTSRPCFIHGELGSGKTELAKHLIRTRLSNSHLRRWEEKNPKPANDVQIKIWQKERDDQGEAIVIGGHKNIDISEFFGRLGVERKMALDPKLKAIDITAKARKFKEDHIDLDKSDLEQSIAIYTRSLESMMDNPIEVIPVLGKMYQAMKEGRPILIDEINAIPHTILIALNDLLTLKPGDLVNPSIVGMGSFTVQEGFCIIATGNWKPEDGKMYIGRQAIDAAFLSRFGLAQYDYLPMMTEETPDASNEVKRQERSQNELYFILMAKLLDDNLGAELPAGSLEKIKALAKCSRIIQDIFSEKQSTIAFTDENGSSFSGKELERFLSENVLSNRHLMPIILKWKKDGFIRPIEDYIFLEYLDRSKARPKEMMLLYQILQTQSGEMLFPKSEGWPDGQDGGGLKEISKYNIVRRLYGVDHLTGKERPIEIKQDRQYYSPEDIIKEVFGPIPDRVDVPTKFFEPELEEEKNFEESVEIINLKRSLKNKDSEIAQDINALLSDTNLEFDEKEKKLFLGLIN